MAESGNDLEVLCVCTRNRTRSVMMAGFLGAHLQRLGVPARVSSAGTTTDGGWATGDVVREMALHGVDASDHRSHRVGDEDVERADLVVTAEVLHVVEISGRWTDAFERTFTMPEIVELSWRVEPAGTLADWIDALNDGRPTALDYMDADVGELLDPTGEGPAAWRASVLKTEQLATRLAQCLGALDRTPVA